MLDARWNGAAAIRNDALMTSSWPLLAGAALATVVRSQSWRAVRDCPYPSLPLFARVGNREETSRRLCGSLAFTACMRRTRNTDASRLARKPNEGTDASHNKGRPRSTPDAQGARAARERDDDGPSNVAQAYRPIGAKNRF